ncbi:MAG: glycosyltransferase family 2 protein [Pseudomonadota bacterium]
MVMHDASLTSTAEVLVVLPTLNEAAHIETVLEQLQCDTVGSAPVAFVVLDGGSTDGTQQIVSTLASRRGNLYIFDNPGKTQAAALNMLLSGELAERFPKVELLIRCDAHARYPADYVDRVVAALEQTQADSVVVVMDAESSGGCFQRAVVHIADSKLGAGGSAHRGGSASGFVEHGHHAGFRIASFRRLAGYDTRFIANEDAEYDRRLLSEGGKIWLDADIRMGYYPRATVQGLWKQYYRYGFGRAANCLKHGTLPRLRQTVPALHVWASLLAILLLPWTVSGLLWPAIYAGLCIGVSVKVVLQKKDICGLGSGLALAVMHTAWGIGFWVAVVSGAGLNWRDD